MRSLLLVLVLISATSVVMHRYYPAQLAWVSDHILQDHPYPYDADGNLIKRDE